MYSYSLYSIQRWNRIFQLYISQYSNSVGTKYNINIISIILSIDDDLTFSSHWLERRWWSVDQLKPLITGLDSGQDCYTETDHCQSVGPRSTVPLCPLCPNLSNSIGRSQARPHKTEWLTQFSHFTLLNRVQDIFQRLKSSRRVTCAPDTFTESSRCFASKNKTKADENRNIYTSLNTVTLLPT